MSARIRRNILGYVLRAAQAKRTFGAVLALLIVAAFGCNSVFYQGDSQKWRPPESLNIACTRERIESSDGTGLMTMFCPTPRRDVNKGIIIQFHGNAQNMNAHYQFLAWMLGEGYSLATFDYRGYGESEGLSERDGVHEDAIAYIRHLRAKYPNERRIFYGQSLGGAVLMGALADEGLKNEELYVFEGTFGSYRRAARTALAGKWFLWPLQWLAYILVTDNHAAEGRLAAFAPHRVLLIHGSDDPVVPLAHGQRIAAEMQKDLWVIEGGKHLDTWHKDYGKLRGELLEKLRD